MVQYMTHRWGGVLTLGHFEKRKKNSKMATGTNFVMFVIIRQHTDITKTLLCMFPAFRTFIYLLFKII